MPDNYEDLLPDYLDALYATAALATASGTPSSTAAAQDLLNDAAELISYFA